VLGTALALGPASDHLSCCPLTNFIQEEARQHTTWSLKEPNSASPQYLHFFLFHINRGQEKPSLSTKTSCNGKQYAMYHKRAHRLWSNQEE
jgi:hypothetical protein